MTLFYTLLEGLEFVLIVLVGSDRAMQMYNFNKRVPQLIEIGTGFWASMYIGCLLL